MPRRSGFTVLELLVTLFVVSVLIALIVPAVQKARESSRRTECRNNLRQIGVACQSFESHHRRFPEISYRRHSFLVALLPFLDQQTLFAKVDFDSPWLTNRSQFNLLSQAGPAVFQCPSDPTLLAQQTDYLGNCGTEGLRDHNGFLTERGSRAAEFVRGLSNTAAVSEALNGVTVHDVDGIIESAADWRAYVTRCRQRQTGTSPLFGLGWAHVWFRPGRPATAYNHVSPPGENHCTNQESGMFQQSIVLPPGSHHQGGVNLLFADGALQFVAVTIEPDLWTRLGAQSNVWWLD
jgi:prepilin-type N-terminal cleavage/methylation domain-containing protein/prepilin-type processing-associated H-X9-DG protein